MVEAKKDVEVPFNPLKFCKVDDESAKRLVSVVRPVFETEKSVEVAVSFVEDAMEKAYALIGEEDARKIERFDMAEVVPRPRLPSVLMEAYVALEEPTRNGITEPAAFTLSVASGEVEPIPTDDAKVFATVVEVATM